jgi:hypothetical protein
MAQKILERLSGEELLLLRILGGENVRTAVEGELDRRAQAGPPRRRRSADYWAGRTFAARHSARLAA